MKRRASRQKEESNEGSNNTKSRCLSEGLEDNIKLIKEVFKNDDTVKYRRFMNCRDKDIKGCVIFIDGMVDAKIINKSIMEPMMTSTLKDEDYGLIDVIEFCVTTTNQIQREEELKKLCDAIVEGNSVIIVDGEPHGLVVETKGYKTRAIEDSDAEKNLKGPKESFNEVLLTNLSLIRRKLNTHDLKFKFTSFGEESQTKGCICYIEGIAEPNIVEEVERRLAKVKLKGVLSSASIGEIICDSRWSPFKTLGSTEKPDVVAANLLEGRVALLVNGTPNVLTMPYLFMENFQFSEDYYAHYYIGSINRLLSYLAFFISISIPGVYVAIACYHQEVFPTQLFMSVAVARQGIPFPTAFVAMMLLVIFEILKDATSRVPSYISQSLTIVGTLIIGQAAVDARIVGSTVLIVVSISVITRLLLPKLDNANVILTVTFLLLSSCLGLYGYTVGLIGMTIHLFSMKSFGRLYLSNVYSYQGRKLKDVFIRRPSWECNDKQNDGNDREQDEDKKEEASDGNG